MSSGGDSRAALARLAELTRERNRVEGEIAALIDRPAHPGHVGEFIARHVFDIALETSASAAGIDGRFRTGPLTGASVNVKFYPRNGGLLDINPKGVPDYYLVLAGPWTPPNSSRGTSAPWVIANVFLFDSSALLEKPQQRGVKVGAATSVIRALWDAAEIYTVGRNPALVVSPQQQEWLRLFGADALNAKG